MTRKPNGLRKVDILRISEVTYAPPHTPFTTLVRIARLDPANAFKRADLRCTDLSNQDLAGYDFTGANLKGCNLKGSDLSKTVGLTKSILKSAVTDRTTTMPTQFWQTAVPPSWALKYGYDDFGPWVEFCVPGSSIVQRMRWIAPGSFQMGSPSDEDGRLSTEPEPRRAEIKNGYWMFDTACREALWRAVMKRNSGRALGDEFPVTNVSFDDARAFIDRLNTAIEGLGAELPNGARWEYACRAGTCTPFSFGMTINREQVHRDDPVGNAPSKVGTLPCNQWGLYEMHGNVLEWTTDSTIVEQFVDEQSRSTERGQNSHNKLLGRIARGGSWTMAARFVRSASIHQFPEKFKGPGLGFRCIVPDRLPPQHSIAPITRI